MKGINREVMVRKPSDFIETRDGKMYFKSKEGEIEVPDLQVLCEHLDKECKWVKPTGEIFLTVDILMKDFITDKLPKRLFATKKIKLQESDIKKNCEIIYQAHLVFNSLDEFTTQLWGRDLKDIPVMAELADWVNAESYREIPGDRRTKNCSIKREYSQKDSFFIEYINALAFIRGIHRLGPNDNMTNLETLKAPKSISDVINRVVVFDNDDYFVHYEGVDFIPLQLNLNVFERYNESWFNFDASVVLDNIIAQLYR